MSSKFIVFFTVIVSSINLVLLQQLKIRSQFKPSDFVYNLNSTNPFTVGPGGVIKAMNIDTFPPSAGQGVAMVLITFEPCGINLPHVHQRATEILYVIKGTFKVAFTEENGGRTIVNILKAGQSTIFPQGLMHEQVNLLFR